MVRAYERDAGRLAAAAAKLQKNVGAAWPDRVQALADREAGRAHFEAADLRAMASQQAGVCKIAEYVETTSLVTLRQGLNALRQAIVRLEQSWQKAKDAGLPDSAYYYALNKAWLQRELAAKIQTYEKVFSS